MSENYHNLSNDELRQLLAEKEECVRKDRERPWISLGLKMPDVLPVRVPVERVEDNIVTTQEVATMLRCHDMTVAMLANKGVIPSFRIGTLLRYRRDDIRKLIEEATKQIDLEKNKNEKLIKANLAHPRSTLRRSIRGGVVGQRLSSQCR